MAEPAAVGVVSSAQEGLGDSCLIGAVVAVNRIPYNKALRVHIAAAVTHHVRTIRRGRGGHGDHLGVITRFIFSDSNSCSAYLGFFESFLVYL